MKLEPTEPVIVYVNPFSILERIDVGETSRVALIVVGAALLSFSILERIDVGETKQEREKRESDKRLSVSSNGSTWVKPHHPHQAPRHPHPFSILERIDVGETRGQAEPGAGWRAFSILERIDVGETRLSTVLDSWTPFPFSILERIDVGETERMRQLHPQIYDFQYPRTDRRG